MPFVRILAILFTIMWSGSMLFGQTRTVTGQVIDQATGEPVIGANVLVKGTTTGTITDLDGNFSISQLLDLRCDRQVGAPRQFRRIHGRGRSCQG